MHMMATNLNISGSAGPQAYATFTCTQDSAYGFPLKKDCAAALDKVSPVTPQACTKQFQAEYNCVTVGTCTIHTYSSRGMAHCLDHGLMIRGGKDILARCTFTQGYSSEEYTEGQYEWTAHGSSEGIKFVKASIV